jgi:hypothetical protein
MVSIFTPISQERLSEPGRAAIHEPDLASAKALKGMKRR